jgi:hypothetical protein
LLRILTNSSGFNLTLQNGDSNSLSGNRFICPGFAGFVLPVWGSVWLGYSPMYGQWIVLGAKGQ